MMKNIYIFKKYTSSKCSYYNFQLQMMKNINIFLKIYIF